MSRSGRLPEDLRTRVDAEGVLFLEEQLSGWLRIQRFRASGRLTLASAENVWVAVVVTQRGLLVWVGGAEDWPHRHIDVPHSHPLALSIRITPVPPTRVAFTMPVPQRSRYSPGRVRLVVRTAHAEQLVYLLAQHGWTIGAPGEPEEGPTQAR